MVAWVWMCLLGAVAIQVTVMGSGERYQAVPMELHRISDHNLLNLITVPSSTICAAHCHLNDLCRTFCFDEGACYLTAIVLSANYLSSNASQIVDCYTPRKINIAINAITVAYAKSRSGPAASLLDGYYGLADAECYVSTTNGGDFIAIDLGEPKIVSEVRIFKRAEHTGQARNVTLHLEVENPLIHGDTTFLNLTGGIEGDTRRKLNEFNFLVSPPEQARWIILYKPEGIMGFCNIDVY